MYSYMLGPLEALCPFCLENLIWEYVLARLLEVERPGGQK